MFVLENKLENFKYSNIDIVVKIDKLIHTNYLSDDIIWNTAYIKTEKKVIKILRD